MTNKIEKINYYIDVMVNLQEKRLDEIEDVSYVDAIELYVSRGFIGMFFEDINFLLTSKELDLIHEKVRLRLLSNYINKLNSNRRF